MGKFISTFSRQPVATEIGVFAVALWWKFRTRRYFSPAHWSLAFAIAIFGTGVSDTLHLVVGNPYAGTTLLWAIVLGVVFWQWNRSEGTLSIHSVTTRRREGYYWATLFGTFDLTLPRNDIQASRAPLALERDEGSALQGARGLEPIA